MQNPALFQHFLKLILTIVLVGTPLVISAQSDERKTISTTLINIGMKTSNNRYMSSGGESCGQYKPNMWSYDKFTKFQKWQLEPVPINTVKSVLPNEKHPESVYRVLSAKDPNCTWKYLSAPAACENRSVDLWHADENTAQQWWYIKATNSSTEVTISNVYRQNRCGGQATLLSTGGGLVDMWYAHDITTKQHWGIESPLLVRGKAVGEWVAVRTGGTAKGKVNMSKSFTIGGTSEKSVSQEVRNAISVTVESGVEFPGGSAGVSVTGSHETANTEASSIAKTLENGVAISCEQEVDTETYNYEVMWQWQVHTTTGATQATIATCTVACTQTSAKPTFAPGSPEQLGSCKNRR